MRKLVVTALILAMPAIIHAKDAMDGCGLGWEVTESETMIGTTTRVSTNMIVPPSFGMTSGTLGCKQLDWVANEREAVHYVINNFSNLKQQLATGSGEYVEGLTEVMKCNGSAVQHSYDSVVAPAVNGVELYKNLRAFCG